MRIAFFGGTFDPPHAGHIALARAAISRLALDEVLVAPVAAQPLKGSGSGHASFDDRLAMVQLAVAGEPGLVASRVDAARPDGKPNYTFETLQTLRQELAPTDDLYFLLGADSFLSLQRWHRCTDLLLAYDCIVGGRPGFSLEQMNAALPVGVKNTDELRTPGFTRLTLTGAGGRSTHLFLLADLEENISATEIRAALAGGAEPQSVLSPAVADYIRAHHLYRAERGIP